MFNNLNTSKIGVLALVSVLMLSLGMGGVAAQTTATDTTTDLADGTVAVGNSTQSVYVDLTGDSDMAGAGPVSVSVEMTGLNGSQDVSNGTSLNTASLSVSADATESATYAVTDSDVSSYDTVHVSATVPDANSNIVSADFGAVEKVSGGGGLLGGSGDGVIGGLGIIPVALILVVGYLFIAGDD